MQLKSPISNGHIKAQEKKLQISMRMFGVNEMALLFSATWLYAGVNMQWALQADSANFHNFLLALRQ